MKEIICQDFQDFHPITKWTVSTVSLTDIHRLSPGDFLWLPEPGRLCKGFFFFFFASCQGLNRLIRTPSSLRKVPERLEWLVRNQNYALILCSFSYHKRYCRTIGIRRRKRQAQLKTSL